MKCLVCKRKIGKKWFVKLPVIKPAKRSGREATTYVNIHVDCIAGIGKRIDVEETRK